MSDIGKRPGARVRVVDARGDEYRGVIVTAPPGAYRGGFTKVWLLLTEGPEQYLTREPIPWPIEDVHLDGTPPREG